jgi:hypothetical protein
VKTTQFLKISIRAIGYCTNDQIRDLSPTSTHFVKQHLESQQRPILFSIIHNQPQILPHFRMRTKVFPGNDRRRLFQQPTRNLLFVSNQIYFTRMQMSEIKYLRNYFRVLGTKSSCYLPLKTQTSIYSRSTQCHREFNLEVKGELHISNSISLTRV